MIEELRGFAVRKIFGGGFGGTLADRGVDWLAEESRKAIRKEPEHVAEVRLAPGETYTVVARPRATRAERKMAAASKGLAEAERRASVPTRRQRRAARRLRSSQKHLDRRRVGSRRHRRAVATERSAGRRFDAVMAPSKRLVRIRAGRDRVDAELSASRAASLRRAQEKRGTRSAPERVTVFD